MPLPVEAGKTYPLGKTVKNRTMRLKVKQFCFMDKYGEHEAAEGHKLLVVRTEWENIIPLQLVGQLGLATKYMIFDLGDQINLEWPKVMK